MTTTLTPQHTDQDSDLDEPNQVTVLNDDHNNFDHVIETFMKVLGWGEHRAAKTAVHIHNHGSEIVYSGHLERAEHVYQQLKEAHLTVEMS